ncbi:hypothetical protein ACIRRA_19530 [Nocardia sp. NPDC101769]|uniref:hypothetical protein n=1 Tax=Nocardia sp. NPDC101769 TaxID=3364333 RepID=UPI00380FF8C2
MERLGAAGVVGVSVVVTGVSVVVTGTPVVVSGVVVAWAGSVVADAASVPGSVEATGSPVASGVEPSVGTGTSLGVTELSARPISGVVDPACAAVRSA